MPMAEKKKEEKKDTRTVSELRAANVTHEREVPQMSKESFEKMEQSGRFPEKMMDAIRKGQKWYIEEQKADSVKKAENAKMAKVDSSDVVKDSSLAETEKGGKRKGGMPGMMGGSPKYTREEINLAQAITTVEHALLNIGKYSQALRDCPNAEFASLTNALSGGYTRPSPGGDPIVNPNTLPTGRNLFSVNVENTPTENAWEKAKELCDNTIKMYQQRHNGEYPRKVSYTLWSSEFIETEGATIAQVLYMLGVEPIRDAFGRVSDLRIIPSKQLGRPRIDVFQTT